MDIVVRPGALSNASSSAYRHKEILLDVTHADPQAQVHLRSGSATSDGTAAQTSEARKRRHYARPGQVSFDERRVVGRTELPELPSTASPMCPSRVPQTSRMIQTRVTHTIRPIDRPFHRRTDITDKLQLMQQRLLLVTCQRWPTRQQLTPRTLSQQQNSCTEHTSEGGRPFEPVDRLTKFRPGI